MSKQALKDRIIAAIYDNTAEEITGEILQEKLLEIIDDCYPTQHIILLTESDFEGNSYYNDDLIDKVPDVDFELLSNNGSGTMLQVNNGYEFDINYGVIITSPENYKLKIYK